MRICTATICVSILFLVGCSKKAELPTASVEAPKEVGRIGVKPGSSGLPLPPAEKP